MPVGGFARVVGDMARFNYMATHLITRTKEDLSKALEKSARELEGTMKRGIVHREFGLTSNTDLTQILKGGNIPLVASSQLVQNITASKLNADQSKKVSDALVAKKRPGLGNDSEAYFVGVKRTAPMKQKDDYRLGSFKAISLFNVARKMVKKHTVKLPKTGVTKTVPKRDFVTPAKKAHQKRHDELMIGSVTRTVRSF